MKFVKCTFDKDWIKIGEVCLFMGEIENMQGHGVYYHNKVIYTGYHMEDFEELSEEEV